MDQEKKAYFDELGANEMWTSDNFLQAEIAWQLKRVADRIVTDYVDVRASVL